MAVTDTLLAQISDLQQQMERLDADYVAARQRLQAKIAGIETAVTVARNPQVAAALTALASAGLELSLSKR